MYFAGSAGAYHAPASVAKRLTIELTIDQTEWQLAAVYRLAGALMARRLWLAEWETIVRTAAEDGWTRDAAPGPAWVAGQGPFVRFPGAIGQKCFTWNTLVRLGPEILQGLGQRFLLRSCKIGQSLAATPGERQRRRDGPLRCRRLSRM